MTSRVMRCGAPRRRATVCFAVIYISTRGLYRPVNRTIKKAINSLTHTHDTCHTHTTHVTGNSSVDHGHFILPLRPQLHNLFILSRPLQRNPVVPTALQHLHKHKRRQAFSRQYSRASTPAPLQLTMCKCSCRGVGGAPSHRRTYHPRSCNKRTRPIKWTGRRNLAGRRN